MARASWAFRQVFGDRDSTEEPADEDLISAVEFDGTGDYLATGDRGGRVVIFESSAVAHRAQQARRGPNADAASPPRDVEYRFYCEFQSHEPEFDYLKSLEIEDRINKIRWRQGRAGPLFLLSTNDKTIKLWKIYEKKVRMVSSKNIDVRNGRAPEVHCLRMPTLHPVQKVATASLKRTFGNGHTYHINSLSFNCDGETYLSADDLRINIWNLETSASTFNIVDIKPNDMEELSEVITSADFHPLSSAQLAYSSSKGAVRLCDLRAGARCDKGSSRSYGVPPLPDSEKSFFSEVISSMSDVKFSRDGRYLMARDYMTLKIWDLNMESQPVRSIKVHEQLRPKLCDLYESDCIFDKFECTWGWDNKHVCSGTYDNKLLIWDAFGDGHQVLESVSSASPTRRASLKGKLGLTRKESMKGNFHKKILHHAHHPDRNVVAIGARNSLYIFAA